MIVWKIKYEDGSVEKFAKDIEAAYRGENILDSSSERRYYSGKDESLSTECFSGRPRMTLCIAATCRYNGAAAIVACSDETSARDNVLSQSSYKMLWFGEKVNPHINVMLAGRLNAARELVDYCRPAFSEYHESDTRDLAVTAFLKALREAVAARRADLNDQYLTTKYGIRFADFLAQGKQWYSDAEHSQMGAELKEVGLYDASLIISSFTDGEGLIIEVMGDGRVAWIDHFAVQGTGARLANAFLQQRDYDDFMSLEECLFRVLEAKLAAERDPYVGSNTVVNILGEKNNYVLVNSDAFIKLVTKREAIPKLPSADLEAQGEW